MRIRSVCAARSLCPFGVRRRKSLQDLRVRRGYVSVARRTATLYVNSSLPHSTRCGERRSTPPGKAARQEASAPTFVTWRSRRSVTLSAAATGGTFTSDPGDNVEALAQTARSAGRQSASNATATCSITGSRSELALTRRWQRWVAGNELVAFRIHLPSKIAHHNRRAGNPQRGNILVGAIACGSIARRSVDLDARVETQSILYRRLPCSAPRSSWWPSCSFSCCGGCYAGAPNWHRSDDVPGPTTSARNRRFFAAGVAESRRLGRGTTAGRLLVPATH